MTALEIEGEMNKLQTRIDNCQNDDEMRMLEDDMRAYQEEWNQL